MEAWRVFRPMIADSHIFVEDQDPDPLLSEKSDPDPYQSVNLSDPERQPRLKRHREMVFFTIPLYPE
jgi:hypothetical protein